MTTNKAIHTQAPSNIAFVKYWGKTGNQLPINPSISMTLNQCVTRCSITYRNRDSNLLEQYMFDGQPHAQFENRIEKYLSSITNICPTLNDLSLTIAILFLTLRVQHHLPQHLLQLPMALPKSNMIWAILQRMKLTKKRRFSRASDQAAHAEVSTARTQHGEKKAMIMPLL